jgi:crotonobetainyl-CoA:carnitine CoA-transferase CaiB-like acyl-CoA transferase
MITEKPFSPDLPAPLDGMRVLDLSRLVAGNMLSLQLADHGAEVIKIENPETGDPLRAWHDQGRSLHWKIYARNKRSLALDLRAAEGRALLLRLAATADVLVENFRPGTLEKMDLAPARLHEQNPRLVIVRISGFGQTGPYRGYPGFGTLVEAMSGFAAKNGFPEREPLLPPLALADMLAGLYGAFGVMVALRAAAASGRGQVIDLSLLEAVHSILGPDAAIFARTGRKPARTGNRSATTAPRNVFRTGDGRFIAISASIQSMAERLFRAIGRPDMIADPRFRTNSDRIRHVDACEQPIADFIAARDAASSLAIFAAAEVTAALVYDIEQFLADPHVAARGVVVAVPDEEGPDDEIPGARPTMLMHDVLPRLSATPGQLRRAAPALGADTSALLGEIGCTGAAYDDLLARGIIREHRP